MGVTNSSPVITSTALTSAVLLRLSLSRFGQRSDGDPLSYFLTANPKRAWRSINGPGPILDADFVPAAGR